MIDHAANVELDVMLHCILAASLHYVRYRSRSFEELDLLCIGDEPVRLEPLALVQELVLMSPLH